MGESRPMLRAYVLIDGMQPQYSAFIGTVAQGSVPVPGMAELIIELAPASRTYALLDTAVKSTDVLPAFQIVEREYGVLELHSSSIDEINTAGRRILEELELSERSRHAPEIVASRIVTNVSPHLAQLLDRAREGSMIIPHENLFLMEVEPAAYIALAANEVEKASNAKLIHFNCIGAFGRLYVSGGVETVKQAQLAAEEAIRALQGPGRSQRQGES